MPLQCHIRPYQPQDIDAIYEAVIESTAELMPWMPWCHAAYARTDTEAWVTARSSAWERNEDWSFVIVDDAGRILGGTGLHRLDLKHGVGEIGYWVRTSATGQGVATSAARQVAEWAFREKDFRRVEILAAVRNRASQAVALAAGFQQEGTLRERLIVAGRPQDAVLFARLRSSGQA
ncbi:MAG TPA: GNAT family protein [Caulifigura sp.]|jgi:RimJ/RimL family protein N-acetyltransferase|nr:GNAT family protein [Caulifigura sp.]